MQTQTSVTPRTGKPLSLIRWGKGNRILLGFQDGEVHYYRCDCDCDVFLAAELGCILLIW